MGRWSISGTGRFGLPAGGLYSEIDPCYLRLQDNSDPAQELGGSGSSARGRDFCRRKDYFAGKPWETGRMLRQVGEGNGPLELDRSPVFPATLDKAAKLTPHWPEAPLVSSRAAARETSRAGYVQSRPGRRPRAAGSRATHR